MKRRHGFTLVELLVSMALIIFIMAILSQAFVAALGTFRNLKGQGDLAEKLRSTTQILQHDLAANHFDGNRRLSDPTFWNNGPPSQGFFQIYQGPPANPTGTWLGTSPLIPGTPQVFQGTPIVGSIPEGTDIPSLIGSFRSINHCLAFTVKRVGNDMGDFMSASAQGSGNVWNPATLTSPSTPVVPQLTAGPPGYLYPGCGLSAVPSFGPPESRYQSTVPLAAVTGYNYQWAAVAWFLQPQMNPATLSQDLTNPDPATGSQPVPLYKLHRRQALLVPDNTLVAVNTNPIGGVPNGLISNFQEISCFPDPKTPNIYFNNPSDITMPSNRFWGGNLNALGVSQGAFPLPPPVTPVVPSVDGQIEMPPYLPIPAIPAPALGLLRGSDIQLNDVVSFDVRVVPLTPVNPLTGLPLKALPSPDPFMTLNQLGTIFTDPTFFTYTQPPWVPPGGAIFDTWSSISNGLATSDYSQWNQATALPGIKIPFWTTNPLTYTVGSVPGQNVTVTGSGPIIKAIQITIRIWDFKTSQTRQVTIVQAM